MAINAIGNGIPFPKGKSIPSSIKKAMVLWYDIKRQGATNESMTANPKLIDLSGNGHDATCYNFAWNFDSGVRSKQITFADFNSDNITILDLYTSSNGGHGQPGMDKNHKSVHVLYSNRKNNIDSFKVRVTNLDTSFINYIGYFYRDSNGYEHSIHFDKDGDYVLPISYNLVDGTGSSNGFGIYYKDSLANIKNKFAATIEILPIEYPNALVFDGVDDYTLSENILTLNDFTVITKRFIINDELSCVASTSDIIKNGPFILELKGIDKHIYSFGKDNIINNFKNEEIIYLTPLSYNGDYINRGTNNNGNNLYLGMARPTSQYFGNIALYSFILFNKTLSIKDINWVKRNLIEGDTEL